MLGLLASSRVDAQAPQISIDGPTGTGISLLGGDSVTTELSVADMPSPGLGSWTIDLAYNPGAVTVESCVPINVTSATLNHCDPSFATGIVRVTGGDPDGVEGSAVLARITFRCGDQNAQTHLDLTVPVFVDAAVANPQPINASRRQGSIVCFERDTPSPTAAPAVPPLGSGASEDQTDVRSWLLALSTLGAVALIGSAIVRARWRSP